MPKILSLVFNPLQENTYIIDFGDGNCCIVDPGCNDAAEFESLLGHLAETRPVAVLLTHGHADHTAGIRFLLGRFPELPVYMSSEDRFLFDGASFNDASRLTEIPAGPDSFRVITTPGHTPGSVCYLLGGNLFSGDTLFAGTIGRTDLPGGDYDKLIVSVMDKLMGLDGAVRVLPGHGPSSTIGDERTHNPFLQPFNEPEEEFNEDAPGIEINPFLSSGL
ncbi:MAG: MBL fold metallo-hydrolase [Bacteroidales bacterium]|nr:MBL fold metallo-hydrolase [Bacteroidales bacterium]